MSAGHRPGPAAASVETILIADDEPAIRSLFARVLEAAGYRTVEAATGLEVLAITGQQSISLALIDRTMPGLDGIAVTRALRQRETARALPIILVTGRSGIEERVRGLEAGADDYLTKPIALDEMLARVRAQLRSSAAWSESLARDLVERRALTAALRGVRLEGSAEQCARSVTDAVSSALGSVAVSVLAFVDDAAVIPLASSGLPDERYRVGIQLAATAARRLRRRARDGPWLVREPASAAPAGTTSGTVVNTAYFPLDGSAGPIGLLVVGAPDSAGVASGAQSARRLSQIVDMAGVVSTLLHPSLDADQQMATAGAALERLIAKRLFVPHFQPIVRLDDGAVVGHESLTRFCDGTPPDVRFAEAERLGMGQELERVTLQVALMGATSLPRGGWLSLNVSPTLIMAAVSLDAILAAADRPVVLEITEHAPVADYAALQARIVALGPSVRVAVDDAGSGYASLRHVLSLRPTFVKLDISWVREIDTDPARQALVAGLAYFATEVGCDLIGEGIETEAQREALMRLGVPYGQGYLFGRPQPPTARI